jgi:phosphopantetheinyl transferase
MARRDAIDVWVADLDLQAAAETRFAEASASAAGSVLSDDELERAQKIRGEVARARWVAARAILRALAGELVGLAAQDVGFEVGASGKPRLAPLGEHRFPLCFNLSHSGSVAVFAFAAARELGIDVELRERGRTHRDEVAIARRLLGEAVAASLQGLAAAERHDAFLRCWTDYEARVKCLGVGIDAGADRGSAAALSPLWACELDVGADAVACLAAQGGEAEVRVRRWGR